MKIEFKRVERDCRHNRETRAAGNARGILYDFNVMVDGEQRGVFSVKGYERGYVFRDMLDDVVVRGGSRGLSRSARYFDAKSQAEFQEIIETMMRRGVLPSAEQIAARREAREVRSKKAAEEERERIRIATIEAAGVDLYEALKAHSEFVEEMRTSGGISQAQAERAVALLHQANGATRKAEAVERDED